MIRLRNLCKNKMVVMSVDRTLWPFTVEYVANRDRLYGPATMDYVYKSREAIDYMQNNGCTVHLASTTSNTKRTLDLIDYYYGDYYFHSLIFDPSYHKLRHLELLVPSHDNNFVMFDSNLKTLDKIARIYSNSITCHSSALHLLA